MAERLLETETLSLPDIVEIMGPRPFPMKETLQDYLQELKDRQHSDEAAAQEDKDREEQERKDKMDATKFDPDAKEEEDELVQDAAKPLESDSQET